jgi:hypothetical protein
LVSVVFLICFDKFKTISVGIFAHIYVSEWKFNCKWPKGDAYST